MIIQNRTSGGKRSPLHKPPFVKKTTTIDAIYVRFKTGPGAQAVDARKNTGRVDTSVWPTVSWTAATTSTGAEKLCIIQPTSCRAGVRDGGVSFFSLFVFSSPSVLADFPLPISVCLFGENVYTELNLTSLLPKALFMPLNFIPSLSRSIPTRPHVRLLAFTKKNFSWQKNDIKLNPLESSDETRDTRHVR